MTLANAAPIVMAALMLVGIIVAGAAWFFRRGGEERELAVAIRENTTATSTLSQDLRDFRDYTVETLHRIDIRLTRLEAPSNGSSASARNPSPTGGHQTG
jgi:hypothetical protein